MIQVVAKVKCRQGFHVQDFEDPKKSHLSTHHSTASQFPTNQVEGVKKPILIILNLRNDFVSCFFFVIVIVIVTVLYAMFIL